MEKQKAKKKNKNTYHRARHVFWFHVTRFLLRPFVWVKYGYRGGKLDNSKRPYIVLYTHQTPLDPQLAQLGLKKVSYVIATEDIYTMGNLTKFFWHASAPIPFKKSTNDVRAVMTCMRIAKEGYTIMLSPEGNRTFTGETVYIKPSIAKLVKSVKMPLAFFVVRGGYNVIPRYADKPRRCGRVRGEFTRVVEYEEYKNMTDDELYQLICKEMYVDETDDGTVCKGNRRAEFMERAVYVCPVCGALGRLTSKGNKITCSACGTVAEVDKYRRFNKEFPVRTIKEWTDWQNSWVNNLDIDALAPTPLFEERVRLRQLDRENMCKHVLAKDTPLKLYTDKIEIGDKTYNYADVEAMTVCGRNRLDFYADGNTYQVDGANNFCALKYANIFYHYKNIKENGDGFLGI